MLPLKQPRLMELLELKVWVFKGEILDLEEAIVPKPVQSAN